ncbi:MFS transporter [Streptomyces sp. NPDC002817]|uniref:MFS transporter n=1 Tax=Streptomyces sp. NPDC088357 TaxID=3154655 RepID=UPI003440E67D
MSASQNPAGAPTPDPRRWKALTVIAIAQLMVVLDATVVNIALPHAQADLNISDGSRQWVITAYSLAFGGLLLLGGRIGDLWGRKRAFIIGLVGFALASALGGAAVNLGMLLASRALQGVFGALLAPAALSLLTVAFTEARERAKAFGIFGAIAAAGGAVGLLLGGVLTEYINWRWCMYVNIVVAVVAAVGATVYISDWGDKRNLGHRIGSDRSRRPRAPSRTAAWRGAGRGYRRPRAVLPTVVRPVRRQALRRTGSRDGRRRCPRPVWKALARAGSDR